MLHLFNQHSFRNTQIMDSVLRTHTLIKCLVLDKYINVNCKSAAGCFFSTSDCLLHRPKHDRNRCAPVTHSSRSVCVCVTAVRVCQHTDVSDDVIMQCQETPGMMMMMMRSWLRLEYDIIISRATAELSFIHRHSCGYIILQHTLSFKKV